MTKLFHPRYWCIALALGLSLSAFTPSAQAALPGSGTMATPMGLADFMAGVLPPPGTYWLNYLVYVNKNELMDQDGEKVKIPGLGTTKLDASAFVEAARFVWMTPFKIFGATYGMQVIFPFYYSDLSLKAGGVKLVNENAKGLGDIVVNPLILAWHFSPNFHMGAGLDIVLPSGNWDPEHPATQLVPSNVVTFEPLVAISYWQPGGIDLSAKIMYDFHSGNNDTDTVPGQEFHFDWGASWGFGGGDEFRAGLAGFCYFQTTEDIVHGDPLDSDTKARQFAAGPAFKWWPKMGPFSVEGKAMKEFGTKNGGQGYSAWVNTVLAF